MISKMVNIRCDDYGFDCDYTMEGVIEKVVFDYWEHMNNEHGIDYSKDSIYKSIKKKKTMTPLKSIEA
jgi:predicted small metal-binding protein